MIYLHHHLYFLYADIFNDDLMITGYETEEDDDESEVELTRKLRKKRKSTSASIRSKSMLHQLSHQDADSDTEYRNILSLIIIFIILTLFYNF